MIMNTGVQGSFGPNAQDGGVAALTVTPSCESLKIGEGSIARGTTIAVFEVRWTAPAARGMVEKEIRIAYGDDREERVPVRGFVR